MKRIKWNEFYYGTESHLQALFKKIKEIRIDAMNAHKAFMNNHKKRVFLVCNEKINKDRLLEILGNLLFSKPKQDENQVMVLFSGMVLNNFSGVIDAVIQYEKFVADLVGPEKVPLRPAAVEIVIKDYDKGGVGFYF